MAKTRNLLRSLSTLLLDQSGQGMTEYATISSVLLLGGIATVSGWPFFRGFMIAYQDYMTSIFWVLTMAMP